MSSPEFPFKVEITPREVIAATFGWLVDKFVHVEPHVCPRCPHGASEALDVALENPDQLGYRHDG